MNGARDLPQYFVQAHPALAWAAAAGFAPAVPAGHAASSGGRHCSPCSPRASGAWATSPRRFGWAARQKPPAIRGSTSSTSKDGSIASQYLARFQQQADAKYVPLAAEAARQRTFARNVVADDSILVFGFSADVYVKAARRAASRFFWSRPVQLEFGSPRPGYGSAGLLADLQRNRPVVVALEKHWGAGTDDPIDFFMRNARPEDVARVGLYARDATRPSSRFGGGAPEMSRRAFLALAFVVLAVGGLLRVLWLTADPPTMAPVGVVWHDEGAWVHNARNRALWGAWRTDEWNPVFLTPVFTALEYGAFDTLGVGTWQARVVPVASGLVAIGFLIAGLEALAGRRSALIGGALLATSYVFIMWNRAALMESTMSALIVVSWAAYAMGTASTPSASSRGPIWWGLLSGTAAALAWFTKASAAFFLAALVLDASSVLARQWKQARAGSRERPGADRPAGHTARWALAGAAVTGGVIGLLFVVPHWSEYRFYNWQMSVVRKPDYTVRALVMRASWLPMVQDFFMWMWPVLAAAALAIVGIAARWRRARPAERLLVLWVLVGLLELVVHDSGNERRYVMFIPALVALGAALFAARRSPREDASGALAAPPSRRRTGWLLAPLVLALGYIVAGSVIRAAFLTDIHAGRLHTAVVLSAGAAALLGAATVWGWPRYGRWLARPVLPAALSALALLLTVGGALVHYAAWAGHRETLNYDASRLIGRTLPPGTLVQGKLANGLSLENRIRPLFIGHGFGNYADRLRRDDVRYILTYVSPSLGYESQEGSGLIQEMLNRYPRHRVVVTFAVDETGRADRAALIDKFPGSGPGARDSSGSDQDAR